MAIATYAMNEHYRICTSTSRPTGSELYAGLVIFETDTKWRWFYDGSNWIPLQAMTCSVRRTSNIAIASGGDTTISWQAAIQEDGVDSWWTSGANIVAPWDGLYIGHGSIRMAGSTANDERQAGIWHVAGSATQIGVSKIPPAGGSNIFQVNTLPFRMTAGEHIIMTAYQDTGGNLNVESSGNYTKLSLTFLGP